MRNEAKAGRGETRGNERKSRCRLYSSGILVRRVFRVQNTLRGRKVFLTASVAAEEDGGGNITEKLMYLVGSDCSVSTG